MSRSYSNIKFVSRSGKLYNTKFKATVEVKITTGILWFKKETIEVVEIYSGSMSVFKFTSSGELTPLSVDRLIDIHNHTCLKEESLEY